MMILIVLGLMMGIMFLLGSEYGHNKLARVYRRESINNRREELKQSGLQSMPYNHVEKLEVNFAKDIYGNREFKLATLIVTSPSGRRFIVDNDIRSNDGTVMELTNFAHKPTSSVKTYLSNIDVIDIISNHISFETSTEIERYYAFQKTIDNIYRGKHWLSKEDMSSVEIRFFDLTYGELRTIAEPENAIFYYDTVKSKTKLTKTEELFNLVNNTLANAEASLIRCDEMVSRGRQIVEDIIDDTINSIKMLAATQNQSMLAYSYVAATISDDEYISDEEWKDIKTFSTEDKKKEETKNKKSITMKAIETVINNAKSFTRNKGLDVNYEIAMDMIESDNFSVYRHNRKSKQDRKLRKQKRKQKKDFYN